MTKLTYKIASGLGAAGIMLGLMAPGAFAATITVHNNGALSTNVVKVKNTNSTNVGQTSSTTAHTTVNNTANTGGNTSSFNTGGTGSITTGAAHNTTTVTVMGGSNTLVLPTPCNCADDSDITISGNGALSTNKVSVTNSSTTNVGQSSSTCVTTTVNNTAKTGNNTSSFNTGGTGSITTSNAVNETTVTVTGGSNEAL